MIFENVSKIFQKSKNGLHCAESDSAQFDTAGSWTLCSVILRSVRLRAVSHCAESTNKIYRRSKSVSHCAESDSAQCETILNFRTFQLPFSAQCDGLE